MLITVEQVLNPDQVAHCRARLEGAAWVDGKVTAGDQSAKAKQNLQMPEDHPVSRELGEIILSALGRRSAFLAAALPLKVFPPLFNRYEQGMQFGDHVDNAIRFTGAGSARVRTDLACTLFLTAPEDYDGGELVIDDDYGARSVKGAAGDLVVYPASSVHRVAPLRAGSRVASFFWVQSMVRRDDQRELLYRLDADIVAIRAAMGDESPAVLSLTATYHNLLRMWADA